MSRHPRKAIAAQTVEILERGHYTAPSGRTVEIAEPVRRAIAGTLLHRPDELTTGPAGPATGDTLIEVTDETTLAAARRLTEAADDPVLCLNFASAKNPGGGFLRGAHAQEEGLARSSALYASLRTAPDYYAFHRAAGDLLYSDHMIYSPDVPVFRDDSGALLEEPYQVAFITSAAPNRGALRDPAALDRLPAALAQRAAKVLALADRHGHRRLVLGAWGCGVFGNDPGEVAAVFADLLLPGGPFAGRFAQVVFAVWDTSPGAPRHAAFARAFPAG
ncbi:TIGR02452 family protein [Actinomadura craniellae]|uniref:TIGR02452 family protein n=1 Tax=Actinomadura craniellae TaxID=2231787 RepID=A0A365H0M4_9ACTN|nr:TIGR02452 family protein [Actinomadura craniellae]RAY11753.1 TIGR02452 family protein [Actinomadura craniellae]